MSSIDGPTVIGDEAPVATDVLKVVGAPCSQQFDEMAVQWHVAVIAELAYRHAQPVAVADAHHGISCEVTQLTRAQPGVGQRLDDETAPLRRHRGTSAPDDAGAAMGRSGGVYELVPSAGSVVDVIEAGAAFSGAARSCG